jgi:ParB family chromosome partitioning protein
MSRDEAIILMVESNLQRSTILPSEKAFSYKMRLEAMKRQGMRSDLTSVPVAQKSKTSREMLGEAVGESQDNVRRYIRLTELIPDLLDLVDEGKIALRPAVELSYLTQDEQILVYEQILDCDCTPSHAQTIRMRKFSEEGRLNDAVIETIMQEEKPNQKEKIHIPYGQLRKFIPENVSYDDTRNYILEALEFYQKYHAKQPTQNKNNPGKVR